MSADRGPRDPAAPFEVDRWLRQANRDEAAKFMQIFGRLDDPSAIDERATRIVGLLQKEGVALSGSNLRHLALLIKPENALQRPNDPLQVQVQSLRGLASDHAQWSLQRPESVSVGSLNDMPGSARPSWSDRRVVDAVDKLARERGIGAPALIELMKSLVLDPSMTHAQRASSLNRSVGAIENWSNKLRGEIGAGNTNLRIALAECIGMPFAAVVARIRVDGDPDSTQRVLSKINPSHREFVARQLLTVQPGSDADTNVYRALDVVFHGGNFLSARNVLAVQLGMTQRKADGALQFLQRTFSSERIDMLRAMGFTHEQILALNPVGAQLNKRLDPALGTYSPAELARRRSKNLPCTREDAAERLLVARAGNAGDHFALSFRNLLALGLVSDKPWLTPNRLGRIFADAVPGSNESAGASDINRAFREAQVLLGRDIPRGFRNDLMDSRYRQDINLVLLQAFGLGATRTGSGVLEPIPSDFAVDSWPPPREDSSDPDRPAASASSGAREATWQELMPLLERHEVRR